MPCSRRPISYVLLLYTVPEIDNTCPSAHATDITTPNGSHDTCAGHHSRTSQIDEKNSKNCAQKHNAAQVCAVRWAHSLPLLTPMGGAALFLLLGAEIDQTKNGELEAGGQRGLRSRVEVCTERHGGCKIRGSRCARSATAATLCSSNGGME